MDEEELKLKIDKLSIQERKIETSFGGTTIIGDLISNGIGSSSINLKKRSSGQSNTIIEIKKVNKKSFQKFLQIEVKVERNKKKLTRQERKKLNKK